MNQVLIFELLLCDPLKAIYTLKKNCANELGVVIPMLLMREELEPLV